MRRFKTGFLISSILLSFSIIKFGRAPLNMYTYSDYVDQEYDTAQEAGITNISVKTKDGTLTTNVNIDRKGNHCNVTVIDNAILNSGNGVEIVNDKKLISTLLVNDAREKNLDVIVEGSSSFSIYNDKYQKWGETFNDIDN